MSLLAFLRNWLVVDNGPVFKAETVRSSKILNVRTSSIASYRTSAATNVRSSLITRIP